MQLLMHTYIHSSYCGVTSLVLHGFVTLCTSGASRTGAVAVDFFAPEGKIITKFALRANLSHCSMINYIDHRTQNAISIESNQTAYFCISTNFVYPCTKEA